MEQYNVNGMSCAACSARVEKAVSKLDGVTSCSVSLLTNSMSVEGTASDDEIIKAVSDAGYSASKKSLSKDDLSHKDDDALKDTETPKILKRLIVSVIFLLALMYISMGHMMWNFPLPSFLAENHVAMGLSQLLLTAIIMVINQKFFISGFKGLIHLAPNMDTLVALGSGAAFVYSTYALFAMTSAQLNGDMAAVSGYMDEFYFESAAMILTLITVGKMLEAYSKGRTTDALKGLMNLAPKTAVIIVDGEEKQVPIGSVKIGDIFAVRPGESIPVDGIVLEGSTAVDESALTGESVPVDKMPGDEVSAATINRSGFVKCEAKRVGQDTTLSQIIKMVSDASATKAPIAKIADKVSGVFVPTVIAVAVITLAVWLIAGQSAGYALARAISVLVISCPCALGLATPVAIMVGSGVGAKNGILFKTAVSLEETGKIKIVALDKTGTITKGEPVVTDIIPDNIGENELLRLAYSLEIKSEHPLAKAIVAKAEEKGLTVEPIDDFEIAVGNGLSAVIGGDKLIGGNKDYITSTAKISENIMTAADKLADDGKTPLYFCKNGVFLGVIAVADVIKNDSRAAIKRLKNMGLKVVMLTGDNEKTANAIGRQAGVDNVIADVLPDGKASVIQKLRAEGKTAMVGDGINDAPALTNADVGIAVGAGTDIAIDAADIVLIKSNLEDVPAAIKLGKATLRNIHENLFWAFIYNVIGIPLAAGVFITLLGWQLNPMFGAAAMSLSSFSVVTNALRLNFVKLYPKSHNKNISKPNYSKEHIMKETITIKGMMCPHCEGRVKSALEEIPGVQSANVSHKDGTAVVTLEKEVPLETLKAAVQNAGYKVV